MYKELVICNLSIMCMRFILPMSKKSNGGFLKLHTIQNASALITV